MLETEATVPEKPRREPKLEQPIEPAPSASGIFT